MNWTKEQEQAIYEDGKDILVAAAAGSGKTAVLVERIIQKITRENDPYEIDEMLVATFTNAALKRCERVSDKRWKKHLLNFQILNIYENNLPYYKKLISPPCTLFVWKSFVNTVSSSKLIRVFVY